MVQSSRHLGDTSENWRMTFALPMLKYRTNSPDTRANYSLRDEPASSDRDFVVRGQDGPVLARATLKSFEEQAWNPDP